MALLDFNDQSDQSGGLLNGMDPMMMMALLSRKRGNTALNTLLQMEQSEAQAARQQQMDALRMQEFGMRQNEYNRGMEKYNRELNDYNQQRQAQEDLLKTINSEGAQQTQQSPTPMLEQQPEMAPQVPQIPQQTAMPQTPQLPINPTENAAQQAINPGIELPQATTQADIQQAFASVKNVDSQGKISPGAMQKRKIAGHLIQMGQPAAAMQLLKGDYGQPVKVTNIKGESKFIQVNSDGEIRELKDYAPEQPQERIPVGYMMNDPKDLNKGVRPIPGSGADRLTPENAAKVQMIRSAQNQIPSIEKLFYNKDGTINQTNVINAQNYVGFAGTPFTEGRDLRSLYEQGIQAITRAETGAAMPPSEVENTRIRFMPKPWDSDVLKKVKLDMFKDFLNGSLKVIDPTGRFDEKRFETEFQARVSGPSNNQQNTDAPKIRRYNPQTGTIE